MTHHRHPHAIAGAHRNAVLEHIHPPELRKLVEQSQHPAPLAATVRGAMKIVGQRC